MQQEEKRIPLTKGTRISEFIIDKMIGFGGSSLCYCAVSKNRSVIIKEVYPKALEAYLVRDSRTQTLEFLNDTLRQTFEKDYKAAVDRQKREREIANTLRDPYNMNNSYFFACYSVLCQENKMEYLVVDTEGGQTLQEIISKRSTEGLIVGFEAIDEVLEITKRILEAINPIHSLKKIHCDLSPDNLFVSNTKQDNKNGRRNIKAIDFNSTFAIGENIADFTFSKKEGYSPIELMVKRLNSQINYGTDLYSVAAILFNMIYNELFLYDKFTDDGFEDKLVINKKSPYISQLNIPAQNKLNELFQKALINRYDNTVCISAVQAMIKDINEIQSIQNNMAGFSKERFWNMSNIIFSNNYKRLHCDEIEKSIIPTLQLRYHENGNKTFQSGQEVLETFPDNNLFFISAEKGGAGKTTHLMLMWKYFIDNYNAMGLTPLFVSLYDVSNKLLNNICRDEFSIRRMISEQYGGILQDHNKETSQINGLNTLFEKGRYLLLLDGLNELKHDVAPLIYQEIELLSANKNLVIVLTSRFVPNSSFFTSKKFIKLELAGVNLGSMENYIGETHYSSLIKNQKLIEVLSNPMMLNIYKSITLEFIDTYIYSEQLIKPSNLNTAGELLELYLKCHLYKSKRQQCSDRIDKNLKLILEVYLPQVAYAMYEADTLSLSEIDAEELFTGMDINLIKDIFEVGEIYNFIRIQNSYENTFIQMHQLLRDFLVAKYLKNTLENIIKQEIPAPHKVFNETIYPKDILKLLGEVCHDYINTPYIDIEHSRWSSEYLDKPETRPLLNSLLASCRNIAWPRMNYEILNIINTLTLMRQNDLSGMDMSHLYLGNINLKNIRWSRNYKSNYLATSFIGSIFTEDNWLPHITSRITTAEILCKSENLFIAGTKDGTIELWDIYSEMCISSLKISDCPILSIVEDSDSLLILSEDNIIRSIEMELDKSTFSNIKLMHDLSNFSPIYRIEKTSSLAFYTYDKPTTKHFLDGTIENKEQDYCASAVAYNKQTGTWLRNTIFENNIILEETSNCNPISNYKGHRNLLGTIVNSLRYDASFTRFVSTTNSELILWDCKSHEPIACFNFPGKNIRGSIFIHNDQLLVYGDELFILDIKGGIRTFSSRSSQKILCVAMNPINDRNYHHHIYALCDNSIRVINIDNEGKCEGVIDVQLKDTLYRSHEILFMQSEKSGLPDSNNIAIVSYTSDSTEIRKYNLEYNYSDFNDFDPKCERLVPSNKVIMSKDSQFDGCFLRPMEDRLLFNNNDTGLLVEQLQVPIELKIQGCLFSNNLSPKLTEQFNKNYALWD